jgi:transposase
MSMILKVLPHLSDEHLRGRAEAAADPDERMRWIAILQKKMGRSPELIADFCNRKPDWVRRTVLKYNAEGPESVPDARVDNGVAPMLDAAELKELENALLTEVPTTGGEWNGPKVSIWMARRLGRRVHPRTGWAYLAKRLGWTIKAPAQAHPESDREAVEAFKKGGSKVVSRRLYISILEPA